jgi:membrane protein DedA with SNARE-associated domain
MEEWLIQLSTTHAFWVYFIAVLITIVEGPIISLVFGVLLQQGYFNIVPVYLVLMFGDILGDIIWYMVGYYVGHPFIKKFGKYVHVTEERVAVVAKIFHKYKQSILLISKITNGFGFSLVTLITAGIVKIPFLKFLLINSIGQFFWTGILLATGYFFGNIYTTVDTLWGRIIVIIFGIVVIGGFIKYQKYIQSKAQQLSQ